jgi:hypothetical protein
VHDTVPRRRVVRRHASARRACRSAEAPLPPAQQLACSLQPATGRAHFGTTATGSGPTTRPGAATTASKVPKLQGVVRLGIGQPLRLRRRCAPPLLHTTRAISTRCYFRRVCWRITYGVGLCHVESLWCGCGALHAGGNLCPRRARCYSPVLPATELRPRARPHAGLRGMLCGAPGVAS